MTRIRSGVTPGSGVLWSRNVRASASPCPGQKNCRSTGPQPDNIFLLKYVIILRVFVTTM